MTGLTITGPASASLGDVVELGYTLAGTVTPDGTPIELRPDSVTASVTLTPADDDTDSALTSRTYVAPDGRLHIQRDGLKPGSEIVVNATSTYVNPTAPQAQRITASHTVTIA